MITATRYHDFCAGHRVVGHENKCAHLHGHNYRATFHVAPVAELDQVGRVLDFSVIKDRLCAWVEEHWDHRMLLWEGDPVLAELRRNLELVSPGIVPVPFNPTAENMALYLLHDVGPRQLVGTAAVLVRVDLEETRKCAVTAELPGL